MTAEVTYRVRHKGVESTPHSLQELQSMWRRGDIDDSTEFKRSDSTTWLKTKHMPIEMKTGEEPAALSRRGRETGVDVLRRGSGAIQPVAPLAVRITSIRVPFTEILRLVLGLVLAVCLVAFASIVLWTVLRRFIG